MIQRPRPTLSARVLAAESAVARFNGLSFAWGKRDCLRLAAHTLRELGFSPPLREAGVYATLLGARRALKRTGHATLPEWIDAWGLRRIPPAFALTADILAYPSGDPRMPALAVALGNGRSFGFVPEAQGACVFRPLVPALMAWSV